MTEIKNSTYKVKGRIWIEINNEAFIGEGKALLLKKTAELGSLRKAAAELNISYRKAWYGINKMNKSAESPVIILKHGGRQGGIAEITPFGKKILKKFEAIEKEFTTFLNDKTKELKK
ncbi:MAG: LysR family transcriptional regulator [Chlorobi bacterium]|nr:LysR family transcriptional regulator [Chlorobiota bacterium]